MTPAARIAAAIEVLDRVREGMPAEKVLTTWARGNRFAGSKDRAGVRDLVFDALRRRASYAARGGGETGRALMIGALRAEGRDPAEVFTGEGYAPALLTPEETAYRAPPEADWPRWVRLDYPRWLDDELGRSLGEDLEEVMALMQQRAPVFLRVNLLKSTPEAAAAALAGEGIVTVPHPLSGTALCVTEGARRVHRAAAYLDGAVELQDASSQAVVEALGPPTGEARALDYCAGGGGKALALAASGWRVTAHDADPGRMADLPARAARAGAEIGVVPSGAAADGFDLVFADAPCSGSGAWRRQPEARWRLTPERLAGLTALQDTILAECAARVAPGGRLGYATCSLLRCENEDRIERFLGANAGWRLSHARTISPRQGGDGFFVALMEQTS